MLDEFFIESMSLAYIIGELVKASILRLTEYDDDADRYRGMEGFYTGLYKVKDTSGQEAFLVTHADVEKTLPDVVQVAEI